MTNDGMKNMTALYALVCEESSFQVKEIWNVSTTEKNQDWDENVKIMEHNK